MVSTTSTKTEGTGQARDEREGKAPGPVDQNEKTRKPAKTTGRTKSAKANKLNLFIDKQALKRLRLVAVAFSHVEREFFATEGAYIAEVEVEERAQQVVEELKKLGIEAKGYPANQYFLPSLLVDKPNVVLNLVDTLKGSDLLQTSVPAALELANIPYTGAGMQGLVIGNDRHLTKQLLVAADIPTPEFQFIRRAGTAIKEEIGLPLIVKLNESGGSVGIDDNAVKETRAEAQKQVDELISTYKIPVIVERFIDGREVNAIVYDDGKRKHILLGEKVYRSKNDGKHAFTSLESYNDPKAWRYQRVEEPLATKLSTLASRAFMALGHRDYCKFDIRIEDKTGTPYFSDSNPNTAFGPGNDIPFTQVLELYGGTFQDLLASLMSKYAKKIKPLG